MHISIIIGSPRVHGNSSHIASYLKQELAIIKPNSSCDIIWLTRMNIHPCKGCERCSHTAECIIPDDMQNLYHKIINSDMIFFVSPIYFGSITAQMKAFIDRFQPFYGAKYILNQPKIPEDNSKLALLITVSGRKNQRFHENAKEIIVVFCLNSNIKLGSDLYLSEIDSPGEVNQKPDALNKISELARLLVI